MLTQKDVNEIGRLIEEKLDEKTKLLPTKDEFFSKMDEVMGELKAIREEQAIQSDTLSRNSDELEEHEERVTRLEKPATL